MGLINEKGIKKTWFYLLEGKIKLSDLDYDSKFALWSNFYADIILFDLLRKKYFPDFAPKNKIIEFIERIFDNESDGIISYLISDLYNEGEFGNISSFHNYLQSCLLYLLREVHNDKIKIEALKRSNSDVFKCALLLSIDDDDILCSFLDKTLDSEFLMKIAKSRSSDKVKLKVISLLDDVTLKLKLACILKSDDNKKNILEVFNVEQQIELVCSFSSDVKKFEFLKRNTFSKELKAKVILSLKEERLRRDILMQMYELNELGVYAKDYTCECNIYDAGEDALPSDMTLGVEIEAEGEMAKIICGCGGKLLDTWEVKEDASIENGVEFASKILHYDESDITDIYKVCNFARANNLISTENCAGHLHIGYETLNSPEAWFWFYYIYSKCEKIFYVICNEIGSVPRKCLGHFAPPVSSRAAFIFLNGPIKGDMSDTLEELKEAFPSRYSGINVARIKYNTVEFRVPNGSLNPDVIVQNMLLYGNLMKIARNLSLLPLEKEKYEIIKSFEREDLDDEARFELLMKLLFRNEKNREIFRERYKANYYSFIEDGYQGFYRSMKDKINLKSENISI